MCLVLRAMTSRIERERARERDCVSILRTMTTRMFDECSFLLLSLDAHNHVDDYSGTLGGVHKVHISALVTSPKN